MSCYFRHIKDVLQEAGVTVTPENKKAIDRAVHRLVKVPYKKCMPDCWEKVKKQMSRVPGRRRLVAEIKKIRTHSGSSASPQKR